MLSQIPVNRPHCPVNDMLRDGMHQTAVHTGVAPYRPNSLDGGRPLVADTPDGGYVQIARPVEGKTIRADGTTPSGDIKLVLLLQEAFRHAKALGAWGDGTAALEAAGIPADSAGVVTADAVVKSFTDQLAAAVGLHRA